MSFELRDGQGTLFINDKEGVENRPDRRGELNIGGTIYRLSGWLKKGPKGPWLSLNAEVPQARQEQPAKQARSDADDDIPFN